MIENNFLFLFTFEFAFLILFLILWDYGNASVFLYNHILCLKSPEQKRLFEKIIYFKQIPILKSKEFL